MINVDVVICHFHCCGAFVSILLESKLGLVNPLLTYFPVCVCVCVCVSVCLSLSVSVLASFGK